MDDRDAEPARRLQLALDPPATVTPEWISEHTSYTYLGSAAFNTARLDEIGLNVLVHAKVNEPYRIMGGDAKFFEAVPFADLFGHGLPAPKEWLVGAITESRQRLKSAEAKPDP